MAYEDGLRDFLTNTSADYSLLGGIISGGTISVVLTVTVSLCTHDIQTNHDSERVWDRTLSIDNPLNPWRRTYQEELEEIQVTEDTIINTTHMAKIFRKARLLAVIGGSISLVIFGVVIPSSVLSMEILSLEQFNSWFTACQIWVMIAAAFAILVPPLEEITQIVKYYLKHSRKKTVCTDKTHIGNSSESTQL